MRNRDVSLVVGLVGAVFIALPATHVLVGGTAGIVHAVFTGFGLALFAVAAAAGARQ